MTIPTTVVDLYAGNLRQSPDWVDVTNTYLDRLGYYAQIRQYAQNVPLERQVNIFGGLRRRFEKHVPWEKRRLDRVALFQAVRGLKFQPDFTFNRPEFNTIPAHGITM